MRIRDGNTVTSDPESSKAIAGAPTRSSFTKNFRESADKRLTFLVGAFLLRFSTGGDLAITGVLSSSSSSIEASGAKREV